PRLELECAVLNGVDDIADCREVKIRRRVCRTARRTLRLAGVALKETMRKITAVAFDDGKRPIAHMRHQPFRDIEVIARDIELRDAAALCNDAIRIADRHPGHFGFGALCT